MRINRSHIILFLLPALLFLCGFTHKFYVSITQVDYKPEEAALQITSKLFTDDLEAAIERSHPDVVLGLGTKQQHAEADSYIASYLMEHFKLNVNDKAAQWDWVGFETEFDVTWCYMEASKVKRLETIEVENNIFTEVFEEQANVVDVTVAGETKSLLLGKEASTATLSFEK